MTGWTSLNSWLSNLSPNVLLEKVFPQNPLQWHRPHTTIWWGHLSPKVFPAQSRSVYTQKTRMKVSSHHLAYCNMYASVTLAKPGGGWIVGYVYIEALLVAFPLTSSDPYHLFGDTGGHRDVDNSLFRSSSSESDSLGQLSAASIIKNDTVFARDKTLGADNKSLLSSRYHVSSVV